MGRSISVEVNSTLTVMINAKVVKYFNRITGNKSFKKYFLVLKKILTLVILTLLLTALMVASSVAKASFDKRTKADRRAQRVDES